MHSPGHLIQPAAYAPDLCRFLIDGCEQKARKQATVVRPEGDVIHDIRHVEEAAISPGDKIWQWLHDDMMHRMRYANRLWGFDVVHMPQFQYLVYPEGGHYGWHNDVIFDMAAEQRKISMTLLLDQPGDDFEGGAFELKTIGPDFQGLSNRGDIVFFPSFAEHQVCTVTKGLRRSIVAWFYGPRWR